eukprot:3471245-Alexandrium_andersonii.AAC.1
MAWAQEQSAREKAMRCMGPSSSDASPVLALPAAPKPVPALRARSRSRHAEQAAKGSLPPWRRPK